MRIHALHRWDLSLEEAAQLQRELAPRVSTRTPLTRCELVAGADIAYNRFSTRHYAAVVVLRAPDWEVVEVQEAVGEAAFPYQPGYLSFREVPVLLEAFAKVETQPDVVMVDGQGVAHPRRFGLACHLGLLLDVPCLGCAKTRLTGFHKELGQEAGSLAALVDGTETVGYAVRTGTGVKPVYVSAGHRIDLASSVLVVLATCRESRVPEPTRQAHLRVNEMRRREEG
ncbi:MAG: deoxyribonuclease V [Gemmataceae bacterium]|nr:deoxyribonuclease V [Gemmataceae bacterium]